LECRGSGIATGIGARSKGMAKNRQGSKVLARYFNEISSIPVLTRAQERELAQEIRDGKPNAFQRLIESNLRFVVKVALDYRGRGVPFEDLVNAGNLGLIYAAERFDETKNVKFITYAMFWVRKAIREALSEQSRIVRVPSYQLKKYREIREVRQALQCRLGRPPSRKEISDTMSIRPALLEKLLQRGGPEISLDEAVRDREEATLEDKLIDMKQESIELIVAAKRAFNDLKGLLSDLGSREQAVLTHRFGLDGNKPLTLAGIGDLLGVSRERVRQIERDAIDTIRVNIRKRRRIRAASRPPVTAQTLRPSSL